VVATNGAFDPKSGRGTRAKASALHCMERAIYQILEIHAAHSYER